VVEEVIEVVEVVVIDDTYDDSSNQTDMTNGTCQNCEPDSNTTDAGGQYSDDYDIVEEVIEVVEVVVTEYDTESGSDNCWNGTEQHRTSCRADYPVDNNETAESWSRVTPQDGNDASIVQRLLPTSSSANCTRPTITRTVYPAWYTARPKADAAVERLGGRSEDTELAYCESNDDGLQPIQHPHDTRVHDDKEDGWDSEDWLRLWLTRD
jgi:hypothetical protein